MCFETETSASAHESDTDLSSVGLGGEELESALEAIIELLDIVHGVSGVVASLFRLLQHSSGFLTDFALAGGRGVHLREDTVSFTSVFGLLLEFVLEVVDIGGGDLLYHCYYFSD